MMEPSNEHQESEEALVEPVQLLLLMLYVWTHLNVDWPYQDFIKSLQGKSTFKCAHQENEEAV